MRIERRSNGKHRYLLAVEDVWDNHAARFRRRVVITFGREGERRTDVRLQGFLHALEGSEDYPTFRRRKP